jgi:cytochrome c553
MKKISVLLLVVVAVSVFTYCSSSKKAAKVIPKTTYEANVAPIIAATCAPCHFPDKGGRKKPLDNYKAVTAQLDEVLRRIQLNPTDRGFMPDRKPNRMADSSIAVIKKWQADGLLEK